MFIINNVIANERKETIHEEKKSVRLLELLYVHSEYKYFFFFFRDKKKKNVDTHKKSQRLTCPEDISSTKQKRVSLQELRATATWTVTTIHQWAATGKAEKENNNNSNNSKLFFFFSLLWSVPLGEGGSESQKKKKVVIPLPSKEEKKKNTSNE